MFEQKLKIEQVKAELNFATILWKVRRDHNATIAEHDAARHERDAAIAERDLIAIERDLLLQKMNKRK